MPIDAKQVRLTAQLMALRHMVAHLLNMRYELAGASEADIAKAEEDAIDRFRETPFATANDPAIAALYADEFAEAVRQIQSHARQMRVNPRSE